MRNLITIILTILLLPAASYAQEHPLEYSDYFDSSPMPNYFWPDTNFTFLSYGFPTGPRVQVMANNHFYVAMGGYLEIFEIMDDGTLQKTCSKILYRLILFMDHDGEYLYISDTHGIKIYDGTDYEDPQQIAFNPMRFCQYMDNLGVYGDSLFYFYGDWPQYSIDKLGIMDIQDRSNPVVIGEFDDIRIGLKRTRPQKYEDYLVVVRGHGEPMRSHIAIFDLSDTSGVPVEVDSIFAIPYYQSYYGLKIYENRLYAFGRYRLEIYEFTDGTNAEHRYTMHTEAILQGVEEVIIDDSRYIFLSGAVTFSEPSFHEYGTVYKMNVNDLENPVIEDSVLWYQSLNHGYDQIAQYESYSYCLVDNNASFSEHSGIYVYDWDTGNNQQLIQTIQGYSDCISVAVKDDAVYTGTEHFGIQVVDVTDRTNPQVIEDGGELLIGGMLKRYDDMLYSISGIDGLHAYNIDDPFYPIERWNYTFPTGQFIIDYVVHDTIVFASFHVGYPNGPGGLCIVNLADPEEPEVLFDDILHWGMGRLEFDYPKLITIDNSDNRVRLYDVTDPANPTYRSSARVETMGITQVVYYNDYLYIEGVGTQIWRLYNTWQPMYQDYFAMGGFMRIADGKMFFHGYREGSPNGINVWDLDYDPVTPHYLGYYGYYSTSSRLDHFCVDLPYVYVPGGSLGLIIIGFDDPTSVDENEPAKPEKTDLITAYPNPFNSSVSFTIQTELYQNNNLKIYDITGRLVREFEIPATDNKIASIRWDGSSADGKGISSGIYFARYNNEKANKTIKVVLLR